jgi:hypothetical protein
LTKRYELVEARREAAIAAALDVAAKELEQFVRRLHRDRDTALHMEARHREMADLPDQLRRIEQAIQRGLSQANAIAEAASDCIDGNKDARGLEMQVLFLTAHFERHIATDKEAWKFHRDREIVRLARTNTNAEIAPRFGLHPKSVSRIVQQWLREGRQRPAPAVASPDSPDAAMLRDQSEGTL